VAHAVRKTDIRIDAVTKEYMRGMIKRSVLRSIANLGREHQ